MSDSKITPNTFPKYVPNPIFDGLPKYLKDPKNYKKIQKALLETLASTHSHGELIEWHACTPCQRKVRDHADMVRKLGFTSPAQYYAWKKVQEEIKRRQPLR